MESPAIIVTGAGAAATPAGSGASEPERQQGQDITQDSRNSETTTFTTPRDESTVYAQLNEEVGIDFASLASHFGGILHLQQQNGAGEDDAATVATTCCSDEENNNTSNPTTISSSNGNNNSNSRNQQQSNQLRSSTVDNSQLSQDAIAESFRYWHEKRMTSGASLGVAMALALVIILLMFLGLF